MVDRVIAEVRDYQQLISALRARVVELGAAGETLDDVAGLPLRYTMKLLAPMPLKTLGRTSMGPLLGVLGLKLLVVEDTEALERVRRRLTPAKNANTAMLTQRTRKRRRFLPFKDNPDFARVARQQGILARSPKQRSRLASRAARARWANRRAKRRERRARTVPTTADPQGRGSGTTRSPSACTAGARAPAPSPSPLRKV